MQCRQQHQPLHVVVRKDWVRGNYFAPKMEMTQMSLCFRVNGGVTWLVMCLYHRIIRKHGSGAGYLSPFPIAVDKIPLHIGAFFLEDKGWKTAKISEHVLRPSSEYQYFMYLYFDN